MLLSSVTRQNFNIALPENSLLLQANNKKLQQSLTFGGMTHQLVGKRWLLPDDFKKAMGVAPTPYIGQLPPVWRHACKENPKQIFQALDELTPLLRGIGKIQHVCLSFKMGTSKTPVTAKFIGSGSYGNVYKITLNKHDFVIKVFHDIHEVDDHGTFGESATGLFFSPWQFKKLARFYFGNPKAGWAVLEYIGNRMSEKNRNGISLEPFNVVVGDEHDANEQNGIRLDYGGIRRLNRADISFVDVNDYKKQFASGDLAVKLKLISKIHRLPEKDKLQAFMLAWETQDLKIQKEALNLYHHPEENKKLIYMLAWNNQEPDLRKAAISRISALPDAIQPDAFKNAWDSGEIGIQTVLAQNIRYLSKAFQKEAFLTVWNSNNVDLQREIAAMIDNLPDDFKKTAFLMAWDTGNPEIQANAAQNIFDLPSDFVREAFLKAWNTQNIAIQLKILARAYKMSDNHAEEVFNLALNTNNSELQKEAAGLLYKIPEPSFKKAFLGLWKTNNTELQAAAAKYLYKLPESYQQEALQLVMKTNNTDIIRRAVESLKSFSSNIFQMFLDTNQPEVQVELAEYLYRLPKKEQEQAFRKLIAVNNDQVTLATISQLRFLPAETLKETFNYVLGSNNLPVRQKLAQTIRLLPKNTRAQALNAYLEAINHNGQLQYISDVQAYRKIGIVPLPLIAGNLLKPFHKVATMLQNIAQPFVS